MNCKFITELSKNLMEREEASIVLESGKCWWGKCYFCGWGRKEVKKDFEHLKKKLLNFLEKNKGIKRLKIFSSGSFLDKEQFGREFLEWVGKVVEKFQIEELVIESRPEFIKKENLEPLLGRKFTLIVAIGLEAGDDKILKMINKGFRVRDYIKACKLLHSLKCKVRTYLLVNCCKELFENRKLQKKVLKQSFELVEKYSDEVVIINTYPHYNSELWKDYISLKWKPLDEGQFYSIVKPYLRRKGIKVEIDFNNFNYVPRFPSWARKRLKGVGKEFLTHPYYEVWQDFFVRFYKPPKGKFPLFLPCSYKKPYPKSKTWRTILQALKEIGALNKLHLIAISSPGVIPKEFVNYYPFNSYDWEEWRETEEIKKLYVKVTYRRIKNYLKTHSKNYRKPFFAYFRPEAESLIALKKACQDLNLRLISIVKKKDYELVKDCKPALASKYLIEKLKEKLSEKVI